MPCTDRIPETFLKKISRNRNRDSCEKNATGTENTGIRRIPGGIWYATKSSTETFRGQQNNATQDMRVTLNIRIVRKMRDEGLTIIPE